jgi:hypothetical protein
LGQEQECCKPDKAKWLTLFTQPITALADQILVRVAGCKDISDSLPMTAVYGS